MKGLYTILLLIFSNIFYDIRLVRALETARNENHQQLAPHWCNSAIVVNGIL